MKALCSKSAKFTSNNPTIIITDATKNSGEPDTVSYLSLETERFSSLQRLCCDAFGLKPRRI